FTMQFIYIYIESLLHLLTLPIHGINILIVLLLLLFFISFLCCIFPCCVTGYPKIFAISEMLLSTIYHIGIFAIGLHHFRATARATPVLPLHTTRSLLRSIRQSCARF